MNEVPDGHDWAEMPCTVTGQRLDRLVICAAGIGVRFMAKTPDDVGLNFSMRFLTEAGEFSGGFASGLFDLMASMQRIA